MKKIFSKQLENKWYCRENCFEQMQKQLEAENIKNTEKEYNLYTESQI